MTKAQRQTLTPPLNGIVQELGETIRKIPAETLRKTCLNAKMAKAYKIDKGVSIASGVAGTGLAAAGFGLPGAPAFAIVMTCRSAASLVKDIGGLSGQPVAGARLGQRCRPNYCLFSGSQRRKVMFNSRQRITIFGRISWHRSQ
ncbi:MAG: hypothetical protein ACI8R4_002836 [Paracoccaceae bacterium]|jgi:hypothetical protein